MIVEHPSRHPGTRPPAKAGLRPMPPSGGGLETVIPFDYAATFELAGHAGNLLQGVINFSVDSLFVATAIGYGLESKSADTLTLINNPVDPGVPGQLTLNNFAVQPLIQGFRANSDYLQVLFSNVPGPEEPFVATKLKFSTDRVSLAAQNRTFQLVLSPPDYSFMFSMVDSGTGRELQDEPTHNLASLGINNGERPFRMLARPIYFMPRSTLRMQIEELTDDVTGTLFIVLYGYKIFNIGCPEIVPRTVHGSGICRTESIGAPDDRVIPFDYVTKFPLSGLPGNVVEDEVAINVEGGFVATAMGYGLSAGSLNVSLRQAAIQSGLITSSSTTIDLTTVPLNIFQPDALVDGVRISPEFLRFVIDSTGALSPSLPVSLLDQAFTRLNHPESVSFRYSILDGGTGRELQNKPLHNLAGLGIANGKRPFKHFVRPMIFLPRSTLRVTVEEGGGRGELFIVFQGYKILNAPATGRP